MPIVGFRFRAHADGRTLRALKAQLRMVSEIYNTLRWARRAGREPPAAPVELRPLPVALSYGQGGARKREASPLRAG